MTAGKAQAGVMIVSSSPKATQSLSSVLSCDIFSPVLTAATAGEAKRLLLERPVDIVVIHAPLTDEFGNQLALDLADNGSTGVLMLVKSELYEPVSYKMEDHGILTVSRPISQQALYQAMRLLYATQIRLRAAERRAQTLEARMKEIRLINRAKWLLIDRLKMSEPESHRYIEKMAMDHCIKRSQVAENIIRTYDN